MFGPGTDSDKDLPFNPMDKSEMQDFIKQSN